MTQSSFTANTHNIKYWASEGNEYGEIWSNDPSVNVSFNLMDLNLKQKWGGNSSSSLEFLFLAACNLVNGAGANPRKELANAMIGPGAMRAVCGYHENAPSEADLQVVDKFMDYAESGESVKSSWMQANEYVYNYGTGARSYCKNYIVLTHNNNSQYSRFPGFPGNTYSRPTTSTSIVRFTRAYPNGNAQELTGYVVGDTLTNEQIVDFNSNLSRVLPTINLSTVTLQTRTSANNLVDNDDGVIEISNFEIGHTPISIDEKEAAESALAYISEEYIGLQPEALENSLMTIAPIVMAEVNLDGDASQEVENTVAYIVNIQNAYNGIPIDGSVFSIAVDETGIPFSSGKWHSVQIEMGAAQMDTEVMSLTEIIDALSEQATCEEMQMNVAEGNASRTVESYYIHYVPMGNLGVYKPICSFTMMDGKQLDVDLTAK